MVDMLKFLFLIPALPFAGFLVLALFGRRLSKSSVALAGAGSVGISALLSIAAAIDFAGRLPEDRSFTQTFWTWMQFESYAAEVSFMLDPLSLLMMLVITIVGFLIHLYSVEYGGR